ESARGQSNQREKPYTAGPSDGQAPHRYPTFLLRPVERYTGPSLFRGQRFWLSPRQRLFCASASVSKRTHARPSGPLLVENDQERRDHHCHSQTNRCVTA